MPEPATGDRAAAGRSPDVDSWLAAAARTSWLPVDHACYDLPLDQAAGQLRVAPAMVDALLADGMPSAPGADGAPLLDRYDIFNLALDSGWRRAVPVLGYRYAMRWLAAPIDELVERRAWQVGIAGPTPAEVPELLISAPEPERHGGRYVDADARAVDTAIDGVRRMRVAAGETLRGQATVLGHHTPIRAPQIREAIADVVCADLRWAKLPLTLQTRPDVVERLGYATCLTTSARLARRLRGDGFEVTTHLGWLMGMLPAVHSWVEVRDEDGCVKVADPVLALLRRRLDALEGVDAPSLRARAIPAAEQLADGLLTNRMLPTASSTQDPLAIDAAGVGRAVVPRFAPRQREPDDPSA
jgi:hypothetical protein